MKPGGDPCCPLNIVIESQQMLIILGNYVLDTPMNYVLDIPMNYILDIPMKWQNDEVHIPASGGIAKKQLIDRTWG